MEVLLVLPLFAFEPHLLVIVTLDSTHEIWPFHTQNYPFLHLFFRELEMPFSRPIQRAWSYPQEDLTERWKPLGSSDECSEFETHE
jgi:hypothetical protein